MESASNFAYLKCYENQEEEDMDRLSVNSDELNRSFESDDEEEEQVDFLDMNKQELNSRGAPASVDLLGLDDVLAQPEAQMMPPPPVQQPQSMMSPPMMGAPPARHMRKSSEENTDPMDNLFGNFSDEKETNEVPQSIFNTSSVPVPPPGMPGGLAHPSPPASIMGGAHDPNLMVCPPVLPPQELKKKRKNKEKARHARKGRKFKHQIDTNVIRLKLSVLKDDAELAAGDPIFCDKCNVVFNSNSVLGEPKEEAKLEEIKEEVEEDDEEMKIQEPEEGEQLWICEFCGHRNNIMLEKEEIPTKNAMNYIIDTEELDEKKKHSGEAAVIFCVDISGSMCVTKAVEGKFKIKGDKYDELQNLMKFSDGSDQFAFNDRNVTYVSRLQCVQAAIEAQLIDMKAEKSKKKVGLVSFNGDVNIIGDGTQEPQTISGDKLTNYEFLIENGQKISKTHMAQGVEETEKELNDKLFSLEETGPTALGPAVVSSIAMAGECGHGSQVFICTDGLANVGVGCLEEQKDSTNAQGDVATFYEQLADYAATKGVTVNIISIKGEECDLETLSPLYDKTNGNVDVIEPDELRNNFANMMKQEVIATRVVTKIKLHKALEFRNEAEEDLKDNKTLLTKDLGNVTEDSEITFEYKLKNKADLDKLKGFDIKQLTSIPFQTIIEYTKLDGMKCIRTLTQVQQVTDQAKEAKKDAKIDILAINASQQASKFAKRGDFREAQAYSMNQKNYIKSNLQSDSQKQVYSGWSHQMNEMYDDIHAQNNMEEMMEEQVDVFEDMPAPKKKKGFFSKLGDKMSKNLRKGTQFNSKNFK